MRSFLITAGLIVCVICLGCAVDVYPPSHRVLKDNRTLQTMDDAWRRTADGWELRTSWRIHQSRTDRPIAALIHPGVIASFQVLASLGGLLAFSQRPCSAADHR